MKKLVITLSSLLLLSGCLFLMHQAKTYDNRHLLHKQLPTTISTRATSHLTSHTQAPIPTRTPTTKSAWMEAYAKAIVSCEQKPRHIILLDVDSDGIPELFLSALGTSNSCIYHGFSYKSDKVVDISIPDEFLPTTIELYRDKKTNEKFWLASGEFREGPGYYDKMWFKVDLSNLSDVKKDFFFGWTERLSTKSDAKEGDVEYALIDKNENQTEMSEKEVENTKNKVFSNYEMIETLDLFSFVDDFINGDETFLTEENMNKDLFYTFLNLYECKSHSNAVDNLSDPINLPVYSIYNYNTYSHLQTAQKPISLISESYRRLNEDTDVQVDYIQISRLYDQAIQKKINDALINSVFDRISEEDAKGLEYGVSSSATIIGQILSVSETSSYYHTDAVHPWQDMNAYVFNYITGQDVKLADIITIDDRLKAKMFAGKFQGDRVTHEECLEWGIYDELYNSLLYDYNSTEGRQGFYLTEYKLGFILGVDHASGDYWTFEVPYSDVEELLNPAFAAPKF